MGDKKYVLITGGSSGIGFATAVQLAEQNINVILVSSNQNKLEQAVRKLTGEGHFFICNDLGNLTGIGAIFEELQKRNIKLDGFVHSAGCSPLCLLKDNTPEQMEQVFKLNVFSFIELVKFFQLENHSKQGSRIVAVSSITAHGAGYRQTLYGASKAALISAVKLMARELLNRDIRVNCVSPGVTDTPMLDQLRQNSSDLDTKIKANQCFGAIPSRDIALRICDLLGTGSDYLTGSEVVLDGGASLK